MTRYAIGLGSNEGDRLAHLRLAAQEMEALGRVDAVSSLYETAPIGGPEQGPFLNAVAVIEAQMEPAELLSTLHGIESTAGRERAVRWGPRTLDLDIIASDGPPVATDELTIPHPRASEREFVLRPLSEVWPEADVGGRSSLDALSGVEDQGVERLRRSWLDDTDRWIGWVWVSAQMGWFGAIALALFFEGDVPDSLDATALAGGILALGGAALALESSRRLGPSLTPLPDPTDEATLVESGPYARVRHPIYGGVALFMLGVSSVLGSLLGVVLSLGLFGFFYLKTGFEERRLRVRYAGYRSYRQRVRPRLLPYLF